MVPPTTDDDTELKVPRKPIIILDDDTGLKVLREPTFILDAEDGNRVIDIVAVHGLGAHPDCTWTKKRGGKGEDAEYRVNWLENEEMLPAVVPNARIMRYGYKSSWFGPEAIKQSARNVATRLLVALRRERKSCAGRPLIFIAHSFGGLVVLKALCDACHDSKEWPGLLDAVRGLVFFGTPFRGADGMSQSEMVQAAAREYEAEDIEGEPLHILDPGNELLQDLVDDFQKRVWAKMSHAQIVCFFELQASEIGAIVGKQRRKAFAVSERSGCLDVSDRVSKHPLERTHFDMNKFARPVEEDYLLVAEMLESLAVKAQQPPLLQSTKVPAAQSVFDETTYEQASRRRVNYFKGRQEQLTQIHEYFSYTTPNESHVLVLQAMGGQGKSQIALEYCRQLKSTYSMIFWVNASSETMAVQSMERVAAEIGQVLVGIEDSRTKVGVVIRALTQRTERWLMVLDNYDDPDHFSTINQYISSHGLGDVLITSRNRELDGLGKVLTVPPMAEHEGVELLLREQPQSRTDFHIQKCTEIVQRLGGLPLAIDQTAAFIRYKKISLDQLDDFLILYEEQREQVLRYTSRRFWKYRTVQLDGKEEENREISAFTTWEMSFQQLEEDETRRRDIEHFLTVSAFLQPKMIGESLFRNYWEYTKPTPMWMKIFSEKNLSGHHSPQPSESDGNFGSDGESHPMPLLEPRLDTQDETSLLSQEVWNSDLFWGSISKAYELSLLDGIAPGTSVHEAYFSLHPVICDWLQSRAGLNSTRDFVLEGIEIVTDSICEMDHSENYSSQERKVLLGHIDTCVENDRRFCTDGQRLGQEPRTCMVAEWVAFFYEQQGHYKAAEYIYRQIHYTRQKTIGIEDDSTLNSMQGLASVLRKQGKYKESKKIIREVLRLRKKIHGGEHPDTLISMNSLALVLKREGNYQEANEMNHETLKLNKKVNGEEHRDTLTSMNNLALTMGHLGEYEESKNIHREVLNLRKKTLGEEHPDTLMSEDNLASTLKSLGEYEESENIHRKILNLRKKTFGEEHPDTLSSMTGLAATLKKLGECEEAEKIYRETLNLRRKILGEENPGTLKNMTGLAATLKKLGKYEEAEKMHRGTLKSRKKILGEEHPDTLKSMYNLAIVLESRSRFVQAAVFFERAVAGYRRVLGPHHPHTIECEKDYALFQKSRVNKHPVAEPSKRKTKRKAESMEHNPRPSKRYPTRRSVASEAVGETPAESQLVKQLRRTRRQG